MKQLAGKISLVASVSVLFAFAGAGLSSMLFQEQVPFTTDILVKPLNDGYLLGTDALGRSMLALLWKSTADHLLLGMSVLGLLALFGVSIGFISAYKPAMHLSVKVWQVPLLLVGSMLVWFYLFYLPFHWVHLIVATALVLLFCLFGTQLFRRKESKMAVISISKSSLLLMDFLSMIPRILLIFCVLALVPQGWLAVVVLLGCTGWVGIARLVRAEVLRLNEEGYVEAAKAMGAPPLHILRKHIAPFVWPVVRSALSLAFAATVLSEAALSFLDMGLPPETFTWGRMMLMGKMNLQAWWLFVIPVLCIFAVTASLHRLADYWSQYSRHSTSIRELVS